MFGGVSAPDSGYSNRLEMLPQCCLYLHFPDDRCCEHPFIGSFHLWVVFGEVSSVKVFDPFFNQVGFFLNVKCSLYILDDGLFFFF